MLKCPFCHFDNEDGALFCEQCKSDLSSVAPVVVAAAIPMAMAEPVIPLAVAEPIPVLSLDPIPLAAEPVVLSAEPVAFAAEEVLVEAAPLMPMALEATPVESPAPPPVAAPAPPAPPPVAAAPAAPAAALPPGAQPRLVVLRGQKRNVEYPIYEGLNFVGRADDKPVDIDLEDQEPPDRVWCSRQHACISFEGSNLEIEDLNSANGTYVNRARIYPGTKRALVPNDIVQIGNVQMKVVV